MPIPLMGKVLLGMAVTTAVVMKDGMIEVNVQEHHKEGSHVHLYLPATVATWGVQLAPAVRMKEHLGQQRENLALARAALRELEKVPDAELVDVESPKEHVHVAIERGDFVVDVNDPGVTAKVRDALGGQADVILSDLSPSVSGVWELDQTRQVDLTLRVLALSRELLRKDGSVFCKLFEGERSQEVRDEFRRMFESVRVIKPAASRNASSELYYLCEGLKPA
jgi:23S rRNA (uridine2552-2'-O)-methyltransferase